MCIFLTDWLSADIQYTETDNHGSMAVLRRNGLERVKTFMSAWPEAKGGGERKSAYFYRSLNP